MKSKCINTVIWNKCACARVLYFAKRGMCRAKLYQCLSASYIVGKLANRQWRSRWRGVMKSGSQRYQPLSYGTRAPHQLVAYMTCSIPMMKLKQNRCLAEIISSKENAVGASEYTRGGGCACRTRLLSSSINRASACCGSAGVSGEAMKHNNNFRDIAVIALSNNEIPCSRRHL